MATEHTRIARWQNDLLPNIVDRLARETPDAVYGQWPVDPVSYEAGFRVINYAQLANIVNGLAWWIVDQLGPSQDHEVLTYVGPNDVRLIAFGLAAIKAGYVMFLTSPRNSPAAHRGLFSSLKCRTLITTDPTPPTVPTIIEAVTPRKLTTPSVESLLGERYSHFAFDKSLEQARWDPLIIIHTSGSTGLPKPLIWTHETAARHVNSTAYESPEKVPSLDRKFQGKRIMVTLPPFHGAGVCQYLFSAIQFGSVVSAPAAAAIVTAQGLVDALKQTPADVALLVPSVVAELSQDPALLEYCASHLELIMYIGGDLPQAVGDRVAAKVPLRCQWGASEVGIPQQLIPTGLGPLDWRYVHFHPGAGATFEEATDGTYELVIRRDESLADTQPAFSVRGQQKLEKYRTRDLFQPHPTVADTWCWRARADDIIVFLNGEKTNPVSMEQHIVARNPELTGALVVGSQRFQAALIIEPAAASAPQTTAEEAALVERVWPSVEEANRVAPAHARVEKMLIFVTAPGRPLTRAGKGTIQRAASLTQYADEIDKLYTDMDTIAEADITETPIDPNNKDEIVLLVRKIVSAVTGWAGVDDASSFFDRGADSLQALQVMRALRRSLHRPDIGLSTVYRNPSISQLASVLFEKVDASDDQDDIMPLLETYRGLIDKIPVPQFAEPDNNEAPIDVVLTGSTGTIGTYILNALLERPGFGHVFALNRGADGGGAAQTKRFAAAGLATDALDRRVTFLRADLARPSLSLDKETYETLRARASLVIHNAWPVNFNMPLTAFRPQLAGLANLFALAAAGKPPASVLFVSSVAAVSGRAGPAPEAVLSPDDVACDAARRTNGYGRSKLASELLCDAAARRLGVRVAVARVGQVAGAARCPGVWNRAEWLPSLALSSLHLGCVPDGLGPRFSDVDWIPSDALAEVVVDIASAPSPTTGAAVFNLRNPRTAKWDALVPAIRDARRPPLQVVPPAAWLRRLEDSVAAAVAAGGDDAGDLAKAAAANPAIKLVDFYRGGLWPSDAAAEQSSSTQEPMVVERALAASPTLRGLPPVGAEWMRKWVGEWISAQE
ncbi:putative NRPS-like enzyme [Hypoxylon sp. FL1284]|nr:putative NRPS-like enzyme [Hypoxylon sp. FL1284]